jgi:hypothetical protein
MRTQQEIKDGRAKLISQGRLIQELKDHQGWQLIIESIAEDINKAKEAVLTSDTIEELRERRGFLNGLQTLERKTTSIVNRGLSQEKLTS